MADDHRKRWQSLVESRDLSHQQKKERKKKKGDSVYNSRRHAPKEKEAVMERDEKWFFRAEEVIGILISHGKGTKISLDRICRFVNLRSQEFCEGTWNTFLR